MKTIEGLKAGEQMIILKPFSFEELVERIKIHLDPKRSRYTYLRTHYHRYYKHQVLANGETIARSEARTLIIWICKRSCMYSKSNNWRCLGHPFWLWYRCNRCVYKCYSKKLNLKNREQDYIKTISVGYIAND
jgi:DNA-binding response OmpR family regulator